jgi:hypothetical protein
MNIPILGLTKEYNRNLYKNAVPNGTAFFHENENY